MAWMLFQFSRIGVSIVRDQPQRSPRNRQLLELGSKCEGVYLNTSSLLSIQHVKESKLRLYSYSTCSSFLSTIGLLNQSQSKELDLTYGSKHNHR